MRIVKLFLVSLSFSTAAVMAQIPAITGWIYNKKTLETIPGAVVIDSTTNASVESNDHGYYQFGTTHGNKVIIVAAAGFKTQKFIIEIMIIITTPHHSKLTFSHIHFNKTGI